MSTISVIIPVYNVKDYLCECVESVISQTYSDLEIILIDDGSTDGSREICDSLAKRDKRIVVFHQTNAGLSMARNKGIELSHGEYICFIDSDDVVANNFCEVLYGLLDNTDYDFSLCSVLRFIDGEEITVDKKEEIISVKSNRDFFKMQLNRESEFGVWNKLFRSSLFDTIKFEKNRIHEDVIFSIDLFSKCHDNVIMTNQQLHYYRQRNNGIVSGINKKCSPDFIYACEKMMNEVISKDSSLLSDAIYYCVDFPWLFIDRIYVNLNFKNNKQFLSDFQNFLKKYSSYVMKQDRISIIVRKRMVLFSKSRFLYGFNVLGRYIRLLFFKIFHKDPYASGHGI